MAFNRRVITKELDMANLAKHNDNYADIKTELDAHDTKIAANKTAVETAQTDITTHKADTVAHLSADDRAKFDGITAGAEPNQNAFAKVNDVDASVESDTLTIEGGTGITITTNPTTKKVIVTATGEATPGAHGSSHNIDGADPIPDLVALRGDFDALTPAEIGAATSAEFQALNAAVKDIAYSVKTIGSIAGAVQAAVASGGGVVFSPAGTYTLTESLTIPANVTVSFPSGALWSIPSGVVLTINGYIDAGAYQIFTGEGLVKYTSANPRAYVEWWGAVGDGVTDDSAAIQKASDASNVLQFVERTYFVANQVNLPQGRNIEWVGRGYVNTVILVAPGIVGISYVRDDTSTGSNWKVDGIKFVEKGLGKLSFAIRFHGASVQKHDNWMRMYDCSFYGFSHAIDTKFAGFCHFVGVFAQANDAVYFLGRDASFFWWDRCMNLDNGYFIYAEDPTPDGISNGLIINKSHSVLCTNVDVRISGWQSVYITGGCGFDNGLAGGAAIFLNECMDFVIDTCFVSSNDAITTRSGIRLNNTHSGSITNSSIVNNQYGIRVDGPSNMSTKVKVTNNRFEGNRNNDILLLSGAKAMKIIGNDFASTLTRTGTDYPIFANTPGTDYNIIVDNTFVGDTYALVAGGNSIIKDNIFNTPV